MVAIVAPLASVNVPVKVPVIVRTPLTLENTMFVSEPVKVPPFDGTAERLVVTDLVGAAAGAANAVVDVAAIRPASASAVATNGSRNFIAFPPWGIYRYGCSISDIAFLD